MEWNQSLLRIRTVVVVVVVVVIIVSVVSPSPSFVAVHFEVVSTNSFHNPTEQPYSFFVSSLVLMDQEVALFGRSRVALNRFTNKVC